MQKRSERNNCLCCREMDAMLISSAKIPDYEGGISPSNFLGSNFPGVAIRDEDAQGI